MPPEKKRARTPSPSNSSGSTPTTQRVVQATIGNRVQGRLQRSPETLAALAVKKSADEIWAPVVPFERKTKDADYDPDCMWRFATWNVAGLRGLLKKSPTAIEDLLKSQDLLALCLQETKLNVDDPNNATFGVVEGYTFVDHPCSVKKGYSGTRTYWKVDVCEESRRGYEPPRDGRLPPIEKDVGDPEGRVITSFFTTSMSAKAPGPDIALVNTYVPNSGMTLDRLPYRTETFDEDMRQYLKSIDTMCLANCDAASTKPNATPYAGFIWVGDLNVAERDFDRYYAGTFKTMQQVSGFTPEERASFRRTLVETKSKDMFREFYPWSGPAYTFFSARMNGRAKNMGWRLDYFVVSERLAPYVVDVYAMPQVMGSDHCPVQMWLRRPWRAVLPRAR